MLRNVTISADPISFKTHLDFHGEEVKFRFLLATLWPSPTPQEWRFEEGDEEDSLLYLEDGEGRLHPCNPNTLAELHQSDITFIRTNIHEAEREGESVVALTYFPPSFLLGDEEGDGNLIRPNLVFWGFGSSPSYVHTLKQRRCDNDSADSCALVQVCCRPLNSLDSSIGLITP